MKRSVTFLVDIENNWFESYLKKFNFKNNKRYKFSISKNYRNIKNKDIVFILSYTKILPSSFLIKNKLNLVVHSSKLPKDRGFAPLTYQVLKNKKIIYNSLIEAKEKVDSGNIYLMNKFRLDGTELYEELREKQAKSIINLIRKFLIKYPKVQSKKQKGKTNFNKKRNIDDSQLNINKSIKSQFNLLRVSDNNRFPSFFKYRKKKYLIKVFKDD